MAQRRKKRIWKAVRYGLLLLAMYVLQALVFSHFRIFGCVPMLFPAAVVGVALLDEPYPAAAFGLTAGVLCDVSLNQATVIFTVLFTAAAMGIAALAQRVVTRGVLSYFVLTLALLIVTAFVQMFTLLFFDRQSASVLLKMALLQTGVSLAFAVPTYPVARAVSVT